MKEPESHSLFSGKWALRLAAGFSAALYLFYLLATLPSVPFHPDEATYIYMSGDLDRIVTLGPLSICWSAAGKGDPLQTERERDCPLARYAIGAARGIAGLPATASNWDWSADWAQNLRQGAVPSNEVLPLARVPQALLLFLSVLLMARIGGRLGGGAGALTAAVLFGLNSQVLLHARRAMSESALLFGMILTVAVLMEQKREPGRGERWFVVPLLAGAALALAALAKYSGLLLAPVALAGMFILPGENIPRKNFLRGIMRSAVMIFAFLAVFLILNPVFWCDPGGTLAAVVAERQRLIGEQLAALQSATPGGVLRTPGLRLLAVPYELFIAPLAFWDIPNYAEITAAAEQAYLAQPIHSLTVGGIGSVVAAILAFFGLGWAAVGCLRRDPESARLVALIWFLAVLIGIVVGIPILWQRYYLPLLPAGAALSAGAVGAIWTRIRKT
ncbi:MAG: phospholipid carrier-dependent glycosyltransferase [Anaerolineales bacterium]|nr:phospholipid carrier-dependent glycosyltransferase [Anaerolineales bacterium]